MSVVYNKIGLVSSVIDNSIKELIGEAPTVIRNDIRQRMNKPHSGRIYKRGNVSHQASAPGEAPAIDTSNLLNSIETVNISPLKSAVQSDAVQSLALELGRPEKNLAPRPAWIPAANNFVKYAVKKLKALVGKVQNV